MAMTFKVIDKKTGKEPTYRVIHNIAKKQGLMTMDIDQFFIGEDGQIVLCDDCGNMAYVDMKRFKAIKTDTVLPDNPTNGDVLFNSGLFERIEEQDDGIFVYAKCKGAPLQVLEISKEWWNSPYKGE